MESFLTKKYSIELTYLKSGGLETKDNCLKAEKKLEKS